MTEQAQFDDAAGMAALGICELLLLVLTDLEIISEVAVRDVLTDVATAHRESPPSPRHPRGIKR